MYKRNEILFIQYLLLQVLDHEAEIRLELIDIEKALGHQRSRSDSLHRISFSSSCT